MSNRFKYFLAMLALALGLYLGYDLTHKPINQTSAIEIATDYVKRTRPDVYINQQDPPVAFYDPSGAQLGGPPAWFVQFTCFTRAKPEQQKIVPVLIRPNGKVFEHYHGNDAA